MKSCTKCGEHLRDGSKFCSTCGATVTPPVSVHCSNCTAELHVNAKFCAECGTPVSIGDTLLQPTHCLNCNAKLNDKSKFCAECGTLVGEKGIGGIGGRQPTTETKQPVERRDIISWISKWCGAVFSFRVNKDQNSFTQVVREIVSMTNASSEGHKFLTFILMNLIILAQDSNFKQAANSAAKVLPGRFQKALNNPEYLKKLGLDINNGLWAKCFKEWPYRIFSNFTEIPVDVYAQTMREDFYILEISFGRKEKFLADQKVRMDSGLYPKSITAALRPVLAKLEKEYKKTEQDVKKAGGVSLDDEAKAICGQIAPLSVPGVVDEIAKYAGLCAQPCPFQYEPLSEWDQQQIHNMITGEYELIDIYNFLLSRWGELNSQMNTLMNSGLEGNLAVFVLGLLELAHRCTTTMLNFFSRHLRPAQHEDYAYYPPPMISTLQETLMKTNPEWEKALYPRVYSLYFLQYLTAKQKTS